MLRTQPWWSFLSFSEPVQMICQRNSIGDKRNIDIFYFFFQQINDFLVIPNLSADDHCYTLSNALLSTCSFRGIFLHFSWRISHDFALSYFFTSLIFIVKFYQVLFPIHLIRPISHTFIQSHSHISYVLPTTSFSSITSSATPISFHHTHPKC